MTLRVAYLSGPVDAPAVYHNWSEGMPNGYFGTSYLTQFFDVCSENEAHGYVITVLPGRTQKIRADQFEFENFPSPSNIKGLRYHILTALWCCRCLFKLAKYRPHVVLLTSHQNYWFIFSVLKLLRVTIVPALHSCLWPKFGRNPTSWKVLNQLNAWFLFNNSSAIMVASQDIADQIATVSSNRRKSLINFLPTYSQAQFSRIDPPVFKEGQPFRVLYVGRIEVSKGIYDLIRVAEKLQSCSSGRFHFDICGDGSELNALKNVIRDLHLENICECHGFCSTPVLSSFYSSCHAVIVPTTSELEEGYNMVCAESILSGRPLVTSAACPALSDVRAAAIEVAPDSIEGYFDALMRLAGDTKFYEEKREAAKTLQSQFFDDDKGWAAAFRESLKRNGWRR